MFATNELKTRGGEALRSLQIYLDSLDLPKGDNNLSETRQLSESTKSIIKVNNTETNDNTLKTSKLVDKEKSSSSKSFPTSSSSSSKRISGMSSKTQKRVFLDVKLPATQERPIKPSEISTNISSKSNFGTFDGMQSSSAKKLDLNTVSSSRKGRESSDIASVDPVTETPIDPERISSISSTQGSVRESRSPSEMYTSSLSRPLIVNPRPPTRAPTQRSKSRPMPSRTSKLSTVDRLIHSQNRQEIYHKSTCTTASIPVPPQPSAQPNAPSPAASQYRSHPPTRVELANAKRLAELDERLTQALLNFSLKHRDRR